MYHKHDNNIIRVPANVTLYIPQKQDSTMSMMQTCTEAADLGQTMQQLIVIQHTFVRRLVKATSTRGMHQSCTYYQSFVTKAQKVRSMC
jgi:hypothetical protein